MAMFHAAASGDWEVRAGQLTAEAQNRPLQLRVRRVVDLHGHCGYRRVAGYRGKAGQRCKLVARASQGIAQRREVFPGFQRGALQGQQLKALGAAGIHLLAQLLLHLSQHRDAALEGR
jgi:hypothetical protein